MAECQISSLDLSNLGKSLSSYFPTPESSISSFVDCCKLQENLDSDIFTGSSSSLTGPHRSDGEADREDFSSILGSDVSDMFFDSLTSNNVSSMQNSFDVNSIIPSLNQLGLSSSATASQSSVDQSQLFSCRNIWKTDADSSSLLSTFNSPETYTYTHHQTPQMSIQMQLQQQKYLQSLFAMKNSRAPPNLSFESMATASPPSRHWSESLQRIPPSKSLPSLSSPLFPNKSAFLFQHPTNAVENQRARLNNMPFPKHLMPSGLGGVKNMISNCEDEFYQAKFSSPTMDADVSNDSSNTSFFNKNNWMNSLLGRLPLSELDGSTLDQVVPGMLSGGGGCPSHLSHRGELFSRKVFVGGLPPDIDDKEITVAFRRFGPLVVDWPHKTETKSFFPPKGYCFLLFHDESSVQTLIECCVLDEGKLYWQVSSPTIKDKPVQIRPWKLLDADFVMDDSQPLDPRKTIFVGGVPRPLKAIELAMIIDRLYGGVCYAGIDTDPELKYPKGAGRVAFSNQQSYIAAISARFVQLQHGDIDKRVEVKPYVLDDQLCDECQGVHCLNKFAPYFCANVTCLQYYCEKCWFAVHARQGRQFHKPLVKEGADRPRVLPFRW